MIRKNNMIKACCIPALFCLLFFPCCNNNNKISNEEQLIRQAELVIEQHPDSALILIESVKQPETLNEEQYANYLLLLTQAHDKNGINLKQDTLIRISVAYFNRKKDIEKMARSYFFQGRVNFALHNDEAVMFNMLRAKEYAEESQSVNLLGSIYYNIGCAYQGNSIYDKAYENFKLARTCFLEAGNTAGAIRILDYFGNMMHEKIKPDSALYYYNEVLTYAKQTDNVSLMARMLQKMGKVYMGEKKEYEIAKEYALESIAKDKENLYAHGNYFVLANCYLHKGMMDSAFVYTEKIPDTQHWYMLQVQYEYQTLLYKIHKENKDYYSALKELELGTEIGGSYLMSSLNKSLPSMQEEYEKQQIEREYNHVLIHRLRLIIAVVVIILLGVLSGGFLMYRIKRKEYELLEAKQTLQTFRWMLVQNEKQLKTFDRTLSKKEEQLESYDRWLLEQQQEYSRVASDREEKSEQLRSYLMNKLDIARKVAQMNVVATAGTNEFMQQFHKVFGQNMLDWENIYPVINNLYDNFVDKIKMTYSDLSNKDLQLCCFIRAGFRTEELAVLLGYTQGSVRVKRTQLVKKMGFDNAESFHSYLMKV